MKTKFDNFINEKIDFSLFKNKEELDSMSKDQIEKFRLEFVTNMGYGGKVGDNKESNRYIKELSFYRDIRFKQDIYDMYQKWIDEYDTDKQKHKDKHFMYRMLKQYGFDHMYYISIASDFKELGEKFQYLKGMEVIIPDKFKNMFKNDN